MVSVVINFSAFELYAKYLIHIHEKTKIRIQTERGCIFINKQQHDVITI